MENRFRLHYPGNTVIPPSPGRKRQQKTINQVGYLHTGKIMTYQPKVCAVSRCVWCDANFGEQFRTVCPICRNCQYCGLASTNSLTNCPNCGNHADEVIAPPKIVLRPDTLE